ncbi:MAG: hypothetical protein H6R18_561 [Proteobacteria bacterium]|nr:hypothetical protein [Pseudomonadota bacterium]
MLHDHYGMDHFLYMNWRAPLFAALAYFVLGQLGLALAIPPGYASPVFPAAGLALAVLLCHGHRILPGIWVGSLTINLLLAWKQGNLSWASVAVAAGLACGAMLQAWVARWLVECKQPGESWKRLETEREILRFLFLGGPLACLVSASVGVGTLYLFGVIGSSELAFSWWSWWGGDTLGVLVFAPLCLALLLRAHRLWQERMRSIIMPMLVMIALVTGAFVGASHWERQRLTEEIAGHGENLAHRLQARFFAHQEALSSLRRLVEVMPEMDFRQFDYFTQITLKDNPDMFALSYNHFVTSENRQAYEKSVAGKSPFKDFRITERDANRQLISARNRPEYVAVTFIAPLEGNRPAIGFDIYSEPIRRDAIDKARRSGQPTVTAPIRLVQENQSRIGLLVLHPAYKQSDDGDRRVSTVELAGFSVGVIKVDEMTQIATRKRLPAGLVLHLEDAEAPPGQNLLYRSHPQLETGAAEHLWKVRLTMADRDWEMKLFPTPEFLRQHRSWTAWFVGVVGLFLTVLLQVLLLAMTGRTALIQRKVDQQTAEIQAKNAALQAAVKRQELLAAAIAQSNSSVIITDAKGDIVFVNEAFVATTGYSREEAMGRNPRFLKSGQTPLAVYENLWQTILAKQDWRGELQNRKKSGEIFWELVTISPVVDENGKIAHYIAIKENISERKRQEAELQEAKERAEAASIAKGRFLATMSHEIRTPMNGIIGLSQLALEKDLGAEARSYLEKIHLSSQTLLGILNDILDYSKIESGRMSLVEMPFHLDDLLERVHSLFALSAEEKGLQLEIEAASEVPRALVGDVLRLQQILSNLIGNAIKFTEAGRVALRVSLFTLENGRARMRWAIEDSGIGMDAQVVKNLFQSFHQGDDSISRRFGGTGLGLVISRELLQLMGSDFEVDSQPGRGSIFRFELSLEVAADEVPRVGGQARRLCSANALSDHLAAEGSRLSGKRILLAEDNAINQQVVGEFLQLAGLQVEVAENGLQVLAMLEKSVFDAILMDVSMPQMDGLEATRRIRRKAAYQQLPIIALTAGVTAEERDKSLACGMNDIVAKPVDPEELLRVLLRWLAPAAANASRVENATAALVGNSLPNMRGFDLTRLSVMLGGDNEQILRLLQLFANDMAGTQQELETALATGDLAQARSVAHRMKGAAGNAGAMDLYRAAEMLEAELRDGKADPVTVSTLRSCFSDAMAQLQKREEKPELERIDDPQALAAIVGRVASCLEAQELVPDEWLTRMESFIAEDLAAQFQLFKRHVEAIDYQRALEVLRAMNK